MDQKAFGAFIAELRRAEKLTQRQGADNIKLSSSTGAKQSWQHQLQPDDAKHFSFYIKRQFTR